eukprot:CAMPEP_0175110814 /NCGR_PEP_ID=MMETSP0086_2-20121207/14349_1 /TAXON_ID=136419 /ORGANISM="Unknown Unknown, Strain D1" /LENGTH=258 /DNA_ID=CAMNT_0016389073 /DNA_START=16 /DNA_END=792 /DNA_ORIENTATION=-
MKLSLMMFAAPAVLAVVDCGNGNTCGDFSTCVTGAPGAGQMYACAPVLNATICEENTRFSCPSSFSCNVTGDVCNDQFGKEVMPLMENGQAQSVLNGVVKAGATSICSVIKSDLPSECSCADVPDGSDVKCLVNLLGLDKIGLEIQLRPCSSPATISLAVTDTKFGIHYQIAKINAGIDKQIPIPGLNVDIPLIGNAGVVLDLDFDGNAGSLSVLVGLDACAKVKIIHKTECGSKLTHKLPIKILHGKWDFSSQCTGR